MVRVGIRLNVFKPSDAATAVLFKKWVMFSG
jgi:hypothetical protein